MRTGERAELHESIDVLGMKATIVKGQSVMAQNNFTAAELYDAWPVLSEAERVEGFESLPRNDAESFFLQLNVHDRAVILALFVPLIISSGGNSGSQATTLVIRAMALGEVRIRDWWRVVRREFATGLALGAILATIGLVRILLWQFLFDSYGDHYFLVALTVALSLVGVVLWGCLMGSVLPFILRCLGFDPASASAPFVATLVDVTGLVIYFTVAAVVLRGTLL